VDSNDVLCEELDEDRGRVTDPTPTPSREGETPIQMTREEQAEIGFYNVFKILKHKFRGGWRFLVWWENFPASSSTWEPISSFVHPDGTINEVFKKYCVDNNLQSILRQALRMLFPSFDLTCQRKEYRGAWSPPRNFGGHFQPDGEIGNPMGVVLDGHF